MDSTAEGFGPGVCTELGTVPPGATLALSFTGAATVCSVRHPLPAPPICISAHLTHPICPSTQLTLLPVIAGEAGAWFGAPRACPAQRGYALVLCPRRHRWRWAACASCSPRVLAARVHPARFHAPARPEDHPDRRARRRCHLGCLGGNPFGSRRYEPARRLPSRPLHLLTVSAVPIHVLVRRVQTAFR
jgi:hypothetical protein